MQAKSSISQAAVQKIKFNAGPFVVAAAVFIFILYGLDRRAPMVLTDPVVKTAKAVPGGNVGIQWTQEWRRLCPGTVTRKLITESGEIKTYKPFNITAPPSTGTIYRDSYVHVPHTTPPGSSVVLQSTVAFVCNPFQEYWPIVVHAPLVRIETAKE